MPILRISSAVLILPLLAAGCDRGAAARSPGSPPAGTSLREPRSAPPAERKPAEGLLFAVHFGEDGASGIEAVAQVRGGAFTEAGGDSASGEGFYARWLNPGHTYNVLRGGQAAGTVTIAENDQEGCAVLGATTHAQLTARPWNGAALAVSYSAAAPASFRDTATAAERTRMLPLLRQAIESQGQRWLSDAEVEVDRITLPGGRVALAGSALVRPTPDQDLGPVYSAFIIAEPGADGTLRPSVTWRHGPGGPDEEDYPYGRSLVDAADLDGDGTPELVARTAFYEAWGYTIYRRGATGWAEVFTGGGGGC